MAWSSPRAAASSWRTWPTSGIPPALPMIWWSGRAVPLVSMDARRGVSVASPACRAREAERRQRAGRASLDQRGSSRTRRVPRAAGGRSLDTPPAGAIASPYPADWTLAGFAILGAINWIETWYDPRGPVFSEAAPPDVRRPPDGGPPSVSAGVRPGARTEDGQLFFGRQPPASRRRRGGQDGRTDERRAPRYAPGRQPRRRRAGEGWHGRDRPGGGRRWRHVHRPGAGRRGHGSGAHRQGAEHTRQPGRGRPGRARAGGSGGRRDQGDRPRDDHGDQRRPRAQGSPHRAHHDARLPGRAGARPPHPAPALRAQGLVRAADPARAAIRGGRAGRRRGRAGGAARRGGGASGGAAAQGSRMRGARHPLHPLLPGRRARARRPRGGGGGVAERVRDGRLGAAPRVPRV